MQNGQPLSGAGRIDGISGPPKAGLSAQAAPLQTAPRPAADAFAVSGALTPPANLAQPGPVVAGSPTAAASLGSPQATSAATGSPAPQFSSAQAATAVSVPATAATSSQPNTPRPAKPATSAAKPKNRSRFGLWLRLLLGLIVLALLAGIVFLLTRPSEPDSQLQVGDFKPVSLPLGSFDLSVAAGGADSLQVNGQLELDGSLLLTPRARPDNPVLGQLYFDTAINQLAYYNGQDFIAMGSGSNTVNNNNLTNTVVNNTTNTNITNATQNGVELQAAAPGSAQSGNFNVSGTGSLGVLRTNTIQGAGSGALSLSTNTAASTSDAISIKTGNSTTTAAGNMTIDTGTSVISGDVVANKTFETGFDNMLSWFTSTVTRSTAQAHSGNFSLAETGTAPNWGVIELLPGTTVVPGHQYYFSLWVRADTTPRLISASMGWVGGAGTVNLSPITDSTTEWKEITGLATAPPGATSVYFRIQGLAATGETHYFDDFTVTDLSSSSAVATLDLGASNAKKITIGNINQIGATSIFGGSGITLNSGASAVDIAAGTLTATAGAASSISTSSGALTLTSADSAIWGVGTAVGGDGGNLTLRGGNGTAGDDNDGGDLILQGGQANGAAVHGGVIVRPQSDSADTFHIQNTAGTPFFAAHSSNMTISVVGTNTSFASLAIIDAHVRSTQTTPPSIGTPASCGTSPTAAITAGSTDTAGSFTITTGTGGTSSSCDTVITFRQAYAAAPKSILVTGKANAASAARQVFVSGETAANFTVSFATSAGGADSTTYTFSYWAIE